MPMQLTKTNWKGMDKIFTIFAPIDSKIMVCLSSIDTETKTKAKAEQLMFEAQNVPRFATLCDE